MTKQFDTPARSRGELERGRQYRHTDLGSRGVNFTIPDGLGGVLATGTSSSRLTVDQATARLNYRFGAPVVARY